MTGEPISESELVVMIAYTFAGRAAITIQTTHSARLRQDIEAKALSNKS